MAMLFTAVAGDVPLVQRVWTARCDAATAFTSAAKGSSMMPTAQNVDVFVSRLVRAGLLFVDPLVDEIRHGERPRAVSERTAQLRFRRAVGVSRREPGTVRSAERSPRRVCWTSCT